MRFWKRLAFFQLVKLSNIHKSNTALLHTHLKPPKANQTLKRYLKSHSIHKVLLLFKDILRENPSSIDSYSLLYVLKACIHKPSLAEVRQLHAIVVKFGLEPVIHLQTSLIDAYSSVENLDDAHQMFDNILVKNNVCWTALISAYVDNDKANEALRIFRQMQMGNVDPDVVTLTVALSACADLGALEMGEWIHAYVRRKEGLVTDLCLSNAFINMYIKCGDIRTAKGLFKSLRSKDVTSWTSMIVGLALHGQAEEALELFAKMKDVYGKERRTKGNVDGSSSLIHPNDVTFLGVLMACSHGGMVEEGKRHFISMTKDYGLKPRDPHFGCMVDLLCRSGLLKEAYDFIMKMPMKPTAVVWRTLLAACSIRGDTELSAKVRPQLMELDPEYAGDDVIMSNIYASKGMWDRKMVTRNQLKRRRDPGCSSIEVGNVISEFVAADEEHPLSNEIHETLKCLFRTMAAYGNSLRCCSLIEIE